MGERKRLSILQGVTEEKEKTDEDQSLFEFMSITGEVVSHREPVILSPDNLDNIDKEENQGGNPTQQNEEEEDGDKDDQTAEGKVTSDSHPESDKEDGEDETGEEDHHVRLSCYDTLQLGYIARSSLVCVSELLLLLLI